MVLRAENLVKIYKKRKVVNDISVEVKQGEIVGLLGPNGAGKTTIINMLIGALCPDAGEVSLGASLEVVTLDQARSSLKPHWTLKDALTNGGGDMVTVGGKPKHVVPD